jgi:hypothetical protein
MKAVREIKQIKDHKVIIELENDFDDGDEVEVIILPLSKKDKRERLKKLLLSGPTLTNDELSCVENEIGQVKDWIKEWNIEKF